MDRRVIFYNSKNGTLEITSDDPYIPVAAVVIILLCFLFGVTYNVIVVAAVTASKKLRKSPFHQLLALMSGICLLDCLTNESIAFGFIFNNEISWCSFSSAAFQFFLFADAASLALLCLERTLMICERSMTLRLCALAVMLSVTFIFLCSLTVFVASDVHYFKNRNACCAVAHNSWLPVISLFGLLLCWSFIGIFTFFTVQNYRKNQKQQTASSLFPITSTERPSINLPSGSCTNSEISSKIVVFYILLLLPLTVSVTLTYFNPPNYEPDPWLDPRHPDSEPRSVVTHKLEPLFTFLKYMYSVVVPIVVLSRDKSVRLQSRQIFCCSKNIISSEDSTLIRASNSSDAESKLIRDSSTFKTPVLFATSHGLHLRVPRLTNVPSRPSTSTVSLRLTSKFCDLTSISRSEDNSSTAIGGDSSRLDEDRPDKKVVQFSSKVQAISPIPRMSQSSYSGTRIVFNPVFVKGEGGWSDGSGRTYDKL